MKKKKKPARRPKWMPTYDKLWNERNDLLSEVARLRHQLALVRDVLDGVVV